MTADWLRIRNPEAEEDRLWELFHENSKITPYAAAPSNETVLAWMAEQYDRFAFDSRPTMPLPPPGQSTAPLGEAIRARRTPQRLVDGEMTLDQLSTLLFQSAGVTRDDPDGLFARPLRAAPSAGAMFPLDLFFHATNVAGLDNGLYHYDVHEHRVATVHDRDCTAELEGALVQPDLARTGCVIAMIVATFERATQKYGDRGFRFALIESGHIAQNMLLTATALGLSGLPLGGYYDRKVDELLGLDGVTHSVVYCLAIGHAGTASASSG